MYTMKQLNFIAQCVRNTGINMTKRNNIALLKIKLPNLRPCAELRQRGYTEWEN